MNKLILSLCLLFSVVTAQAQLKFGIKGGLNSYLKKPSDITVVNGDTTYNLNVKNLKLGQQVGVWLRLGQGVHFQPELMFNSNEVEYRLQDVSSINSFIKKERYQNLDIPLLVGFSLGQLMFQGGAVGHYFLSNSSELRDFVRYDDKFEQFRWGWQAGLSIGTGVVGFDLRYEGNPGKLGDHITFDGQKYNFSTAPDRFIASVVIKFF